MVGPLALQSHPYQVYMHYIWNACFLWPKFETISTSHIFVAPTLDKNKKRKSIAHIAQNIGQTVYVINSVQSKIHIKSLTQIMMLSGG